MTRILVIDGNEKATRDKHVSVGGTSSGEGYVATLKRLKPGIECDIVRPADEEPEATRRAWRSRTIDGAVITGSALNIYSREAAVERQIDLAKAVFAAGVPCFGSCWGLQVGVTAAGGSVVRNPRGREFGFGATHHAHEPGPRSRRCSRASPRCSRRAPCTWTRWKPCPPARHRWRTTTWDCRPRRSNCKKRHVSGACSTTRNIAAPRSRRWRGATREVLIRDGLVKDQAELDALAADLVALNEQPDDARLAWRFGVGPSITDPGIKLAELRNWLDRQVLK